MTRVRALYLGLVLCATLFSMACGGSSSKSTTATAAAAQPGALKGSFVFTATGSDPTDGDYFIAGSFQSDGAGHITSGIEDVNLGSGVASEIPFTGTYTADAAGNISATLSDGSGIPTFFNEVSSGGSFQIKSFDG